jgi:hypothetical protein
LFTAPARNCWTKASIITPRHTVIRMSSMDLSSCLKLEPRTKHRTLPLVCWNTAFEECYSKVRN